MDTKNNNSNKDNVSEENINKPNNCSESKSVNSSLDNIKNKRNKKKYKKKYHKKCRNKCENSNSESTANQKKNKLDLQLYKFSYADFVLLSSTISYAIAEDLNDADLEVLIAFLGMITSDLAILLTRRGIIEGLSKGKMVTDSGTESVISSTVASQSSDFATIDRSMGYCNEVKVKKVRKKKVRKTNNIKGQDK